VHRVLLVRSWAAITKIPAPGFGRAFGLIRKLHFLANVAAGFAHGEIRFQGGPHRDSLDDGRIPQRVFYRQLHQKIPAGLEFVHGILIMRGAAVPENPNPLAWLTHAGIGKANRERRLTAGFISAKTGNRTCITRHQQSNAAGFSDVRPGKHHARARRHAAQVEILQV